MYSSMVDEARFEHQPDQVVYSHHIEPKLCLS